MGPSFSIMPPLMFFPGFGRVCRLMILVCSTTTVFLRGFTDRTRPVFPASRPASTFTSSPLRSAILYRLISCALIALPHFRSERDDFGVLLVAQLSGYRAEHAGSHGLPGVVNQHRRIVVKPDVRAVLAPRFLAHAHDHRFHH